VLPIRFDWDPKKAKANYAKHRISFETATKVFSDKNACELADDDDDEERYILIGMAEGRVLFVVYTERGGRTRIISARKATRSEEEAYFRDPSR
jgi:hypothetical protein